MKDPICDIADELEDEDEFDGYEQMKLELEERCFGYETESPDTDFKTDSTMGSHHDVSASGIECIGEDRKEALHPRLCGSNSRIKATIAPANPHSGVRFFGIHGMYRQIILFLANQVNKNLPPRQQKLKSRGYTMQRAIHSPCRY